MTVRNGFSTICIGAALVATMPATAAELRSGDARLEVEDGTLRVTRGSRMVIDLAALRFNFTDAEAWMAEPVDDGGIRWTGTFPASADFRATADDVEPRVVEVSIRPVDGGFHIHANPPWGRQVTMVFRYLEDHFFGLSEPLQPDNRLSPDLTGSDIAVEVVSEGAAWHENYASAYSAFYLSSLGYGSFFDTFARGRYAFGVNGENRIHHDTGKLDWYLFFGENGAEIHRAYYSVIGPPKSLPVWALGPVGWRDQNDGGADEILVDIDHMTRLEIPFTAWFVDRPYSDGAHAWSQMNFSQDFANPSTWIGQLRDEYGLAFMTWASTATFGDSRFHRHLPGKMSYLDLSDSSSVAAYEKDLQDKQYVHGVRGHKIDRADEYFPEYEDWRDRSILAAERRNTYIYLNAKVHDEALRAIWGDDQFTFARAAIHRVQPYLSALWGGDSRSTWAGLQNNFANAARCAFMGFPVWGSDVGGYLGGGRIPEELYIRWLQAGSMSGLFEIKLDGSGGSGEDRVPWHYGPRLQQAFRAVCTDRMRWLPYLYSLARTSAATGPLMQPLAYRHLDDPATYDVWDQFYVGDAILVAPVFEPGAATRRVVLPAGAWRELDAPRHRHQGPGAITMDAPLDRLPRLVRENGLYVTGRVFQGNDRTWTDEDPHLVIHAVPGEIGSHTVFTYVDLLDDNAAKRIELERIAEGIRIIAPPLAARTVIEVTLDHAPGRVLLNGQSVDTAYDPDNVRLSIPVMPMTAGEWLITPAPPNE